MHVLLVGAHPDDVEIGAGGLIQLLRDRDHDVTILVVSDEKSAPERRRQEAIASATLLGVSSSRILFLGLTDGHLQCEPHSIDLVRAICSAAGVDPDLIVTHSGADSHKDHRETNELVRSAFRKKCILCFSIFLSSEVSDFHPSVFVELDDERSELKSAAIQIHETQAARLMRASRERWELELGRLAGLERAEGFELIQQAGTALEPAVAALNESPFHRLWHRLVPEGPILLVGEVTRIVQDADLYPTDLSSQGIESLRFAMHERRPRRSGFREVSAESQQTWSLVRQSHVVLVGGPVCNRITAEVMNHGANYQWMVDYTFRGDSRDIYITNRDRSLHVNTILDSFGRIRIDYGLLSFGTNPFDESLAVVTCAGIHGVGTQALLQLLADPRPASGVLDEMLDEFKASGRAQRIFGCDGRSLEIFERPLNIGGTLRSQGSSH